MITRVEWGVLWINGRPGWPDDPVQLADDEAHARRLVAYFDGDVKLVRRTITWQAWAAASE